MGRLMSVYFDANVLIYFVNDHPEFGPAARALVNQASSGRLKAVGSELLFLEVFAYEGMEVTKSRARMEQFMAKSGVGYMPVTKQILIEAARLKRQVGRLKTPDAIHVATGATAKADYFVTNDKNLLKLTLPNITFVSIENAAAMID